MASPTRLLRDACGVPVDGAALSRWELETALRESRVLTVSVGLHGDEQARYHLADTRPLHERYIGTLMVFARPPPPLLHTGGGADESPPESWLDENDVSLALGLSPTVTLPLPTGLPTLPRELLTQLALRPDDEALRLVAADALHAAGDPRGDLIQLEHRLAQLPLGSPQRRSILDEVTKLSETKLQPWREEAGLVGRPCRFREGFFVATAASYATGGLRALEPVFERSPIGELEVRGALFQELLEHPVASQLRALTVDRADFDARELGRLPPSVTSFALADTGRPLPTDVLLTVLRSSLADRLERLELPRATDECALLLAGASLPKLRTLSLPVNTVRELRPRLAQRFGSSWQESKHPA